MQIRVAVGFLVAALSLSPPAALGQRPAELAFADPQPHFVAAWAPKQPREAERSAVLVRRVSLELTDVPLDLALKTLIQEAGLNITYSPAVLPAGKRVTIKAGDIAVVTALTEMLFRSGLDVVVDREGALALVICRHPAPRAETQDSGTIVGTVTDKMTGAPIVGAVVVVEGTRWNATTNAEGKYRIEGVELGTRTVRTRYIGYAPLAVQVIMPLGEEAIADFALVKSTQKLDELVTVTPGGMQTEVRAIPSPITVITAEDIQGQRPLVLTDIIQQAVPTAVAFDNPSTPAATSISLRGSSTLAGVPQVKILVDGVEATSFSGSPIDPASIERIEVIRGPQAATVYGADAAGGVIQVFTKRGDPSLTRPRVELEAQAGIVQTPYDGYGGVLRQQYAGSARGGRSGMSYNLGAGYTRLGDWLPNGEISRQSAPSAYAGMRYDHGIFAADLSARYLVNKHSVVFGPPALATGFQPVSRPFFTPIDLTSETYGARIIVSPTTWWRNQVTVGVDRQTEQDLQARARLTTPEDTLFTVLDLDSRKLSVGYNLSLRTNVSAAISATLIAGIDHYNRHVDFFVTSQAVKPFGTIETEPPGAFQTNVQTVTNTGYFTEAQVGILDALFLTTGVRAEDNSSFGPGLGTVAQPRLGLSAVRQIGNVTVKARGSYGRAIRAPGAGLAAGSFKPTFVFLPNPQLRPERQRGWDTGLDLLFGDRVSLSVTAYKQTAEDLIATIDIPDAAIPTFQGQNIGRVGNRGFEVEGGLVVDRLRFTAQYGFARSRIEDLGPGGAASSFLVVGDQPIVAPEHSAGASLAYTPRDGLTVTSGLTYMGSYRSIDALGQLRCFGGTGPCQATLRDYLMTYPGFVKVNAAVTYRITPQLGASLSMSNLTNEFAAEGGNTNPVMGRVTMVGLHFVY
jgi:outer membrane receptor protein involved in Fe transport